MFGLSTLATRIAMGVIAVVLLLGFLQVRSCQQARQQAAQSKVDRAQADAASKSAIDALATQSAAHRREQESEAMTGTNRKEIRDAQGANDAVNPAVSDAGLRSLCRRAAYRNDDRCRVFRARTP